MTSPEAARQEAINKLMETERPDHVACFVAGNGDMNAFVGTPSGPNAVQDLTTGLVLHIHAIANMSDAMTFSDVLTLAVQHNQDLEDANVEIDDEFITDDDGDPR